MDSILIPPSDAIQNACWYKKRIVCKRNKWTLEDVLIPSHINTAMGTHQCHNAYVVHASVSFSLQI